MTTQRIRRINPVSAAKIAATLYLLLGLIFVPIFIFISRFSPQGGGMFTGMGFGLAILVPVLYAAFGFVGTLIAAAIYNLVAGWVGGIEIDLE